MRPLAPVVVVVVLGVALCGCGKPAPVTSSAPAVPASTSVPASVTASLVEPDSNDAVLSGGDRADVIAAAAAHRVLVDTSGVQPDRVRVIDVLAGGAYGGDLRFDSTVPMTEPERSAIERALAPVAVEWVPYDLSLYEELRDGAEAGVVPIVALGQPLVEDGQITVTSSMMCGSLCGVGGAHVVQRGADGVWRVTGQYGNQWMA